MIELETPEAEFRMFLTIPKNSPVARPKDVMVLLLPLAYLVISNLAIAENLADTASVTTPGSRRKAGLCF